jgi:acetoin utilization protein AcuB
VVFGPVELEIRWHRACVITAKATDMTEPLDHYICKRDKKKLQDENARGPIGAKIKVRERMTRHPVTARLNEPLKEAMDKMSSGNFRHLPVVDEKGRLLGIISDRDIRLLQPSLAFVSEEEAALQLASAAVCQGTMFDPLTIHPEALLERAAGQMLRFNVSALPVVDDGEYLVGIITTTDLLREFEAK